MSQPRGKTDRSEFIDGEKTAGEVLEGRRCRYVELIAMSEAAAEMMKDPEATEVPVALLGILGRKAAIRKFGRYLALSVEDFPETDSVSVIFMMKARAVA